MTTTPQTPRSDQRYEAFAYFTNACAERGWLSVPVDDTTEYESLVQAMVDYLGASHGA